MRKFDVPKDKVGLVYNAVDTDLFKPNEYLRKKLRENWGIKDDEIVFLFVGRIVPEKGLDYLIKAFARVQMNLLNKNIKSRLIIAGPKGHFDAKIPSYYNYIQKLVKELNIQDKVIYIGYLQNIHEVYNMADIVVVPSVCEEACPSVILEAMATGKPVVAYAKGGIPELLEDSPHGYLVNNVSDGALALCMEKAVNSLSNLDANALRGYVEKRFSINAVVDALIDNIKRS
jgi:glycosyltransferase involved in cell wall biosynthesis